MSNDDDLLVDDESLYTNVLAIEDEVQISGDLELALRIANAQDAIEQDTEEPPLKKENNRTSCMYGGDGDQGYVQTGMFAFSNALSGSQSGTRGEMAPLPAGYQDWHYRQPTDSLTSEVSMDAGLSVSSMNPNLNQAVLDAHPAATSHGWQNIKNEPMTPQSDRPQALPIASAPKQSQPSPEEYRQYIKKLHLQNLQNQQITPAMQQSECQPPSETMTSPPPPQEEMASDKSVTVETVVYHQELDELGESPLHHLSQNADVNVIARVIGCMQQCGVLNQCMNLPNRLQQTPLFLAVQAGNIALTSWLVKNGAEPNLQGTLRQERDLYIYRSPIHLAAMMGDEGINFMQTLLQSPTTIKFLNEPTIGDKLTPLHLALLSHRPGYSCKQMILGLIDAGADIDIVVPGNGKTPLILALETRDFSLVGDILNRLNPDKCRSVLLKQTRSGDTCLHIAAGLTHIPSEVKERLLRLLVTRGANGNIPNNAKEYPRDFARKEWDNMRVVR